MNTLADADSLPIPHSAAPAPHHGHSPSNARGGRDVYWWGASRFVGCHPTPSRVSRR